MLGNRRPFKTMHNYNLRTCSNIIRSSDDTQTFSLGAKAGLQTDLGSVAMF